MLAFRDLVFEAVREYSAGFGVRVAELVWQKTTLPGWPLQRGVRLAREAVGVPVRAPVCVELGDDRSLGSHEKNRLFEQPLSATITDLTPLDVEAPP